MERTETFSAELYIKKASVILKRLLEALQGDEKMKDRRGCMLNLASPTGVPLLLVVAGVINHAKHPMYCHFAQEKAARLGPLSLYADHRLSRQSADDELERYAGAILGHRFIHSSSGFPADVDEMYSLACAVAMGDLTPGEALVLAQDNTYLSRISLW